MGKRTIRALILFLLFILFAFFFYLNYKDSKIFKTDDEFLYTHSYTKAICNGTNFCEDYYFICKESRLIEMTPTGASIQQDKNWKDPREKNENLCE
jgi:hypothetical protein